MARNKAAIRVTKKSYREQILKLPASRLDHVSKHLLIGIIAGYLHNLKHPNNKLIQETLPSGKSIAKLNEIMGELILSGQKLKIIDAHPQMPEKKVIRLSLGRVE